MPAPTPAQLEPLGFICVRLLDTFAALRPGEHVTFSVHRGALGLSVTVDRPSEAGRVREHFSVQPS